MYPRVIVLILATLILAGCDKGFELMTPGEYAEIENLPDVDELSRAVPVPGAPVIDVVSPVADVVQAPFDIEIRFQPADGAHIVPESARVIYVKGIFRKDMTEMIREYAKVDASGIYGEGAKIPPGKHRLVVEVADSLGRLGETDFRVRVAK